MFATVAAVTPGPSNVMLAAAGTQGGVRRGLPALLGVATGMGVMMLLVPLGLGSVVLGHPAVVRALRWAGSAILLWLSWNIATSNTRPNAASGRLIGYWDAAAFQWANPKSWLVAATAAGAFLNDGGGRPVEQAAILAGLFVAAALPSCFVWLAFGAAAVRFLRGDRRRRIFNAAMGALLALSVVAILY